MRSAHRPSKPLSPPGNYPCNKTSCKTCPFLDSNLEFTGPSGRRFNIRAAFNCQTTDLVYIITCSLCSKLYTGETYRTLNERFTEHRNAVITNRQTPVGIHFSTPPHNLTHVKIAAVWRNGIGDPTYRKFIESQIIDRLGCPQPQGLTIREWLSSFDTSGLPYMLRD